VLSNHGGRQLDRAPVPFHLLPAVAREVGGSCEVLLDTGIMSGADIVAAIALGARFTMVGRAYLYGLMAGGEAGVDRAIEILSAQVSRTMRLLGVTTPGRVDAPPRHAGCTVSRAASHSRTQSHKNHCIHTGHRSIRRPWSRRRVGIVSQLRCHISVLTAEANHIDVIH